MRLLIRAWNRKGRWQRPFDRDLVCTERPRDNSIAPDAGSTYPIDDGVRIGFRLKGVSVCFNGEYMLLVELTEADLEELVRRTHGKNFVITHKDRVLVPAD
jgi:hypothetical protein